MTNEQAFAFFGSRIAVAEVCDVTPTAVGLWVKNGGIPYDKQCLLQVEAERLRLKGRRAKLPIARREHDPKYKLQEAA